MAKLDPYTPGMGSLGNKDAAPGKDRAGYQGKTPSQGSGVFQQPAYKGSTVRAIPKGAGNKSSNE